MRDSYDAFTRQLSCNCVAAVVHELSGRKDQMNKRRGLVSPLSEKLIEVGSFSLL